MRYPTVGEAIALIILLLIALSVYRAHKSANDFNLLDLLMENGKASKISCMGMGAWAALVYVFLGMYHDGKMTEGLMMAFGGLCFAPMVARMFSNNAPSTVASTTTTSTVEVTK